MIDRHATVSRDRWLVSWADFMTLLCAFFITMYAAAMVDASKDTTVTPAVTAAAVAPMAPVAAPAAGITASPAADVVVTPVPPAPLPMMGPEAVSQVRLRLEEALQVELQSGQIQLVDDRRGLVVEVPEAGAFEIGSERLSPYAERVVQRVAGAVVDLPNGVRVEGHTDTTPIRTARFGSNWELSTARATRVVEFFIRTGGLPADRLSAAGYSQYRPRAANDTPAGRARNRRVDIVILNVATEQAEEPVVAGALR